MLSALKQFISPAYYVGHYQSVIRWTNKKFIAGSIEPLFYGMGIVAGVGYLTKYVCSGRYEVAEKKAIVNEALKSLHH